MIDEAAQRDLGSAPVFPPVPASVREVRRLVVASVDGVDPRTVELLQLVASELATNAVIHAGTPFTVSVTVTARTVRVSVSDRSGGHPVMREADDAGGRGLRIVDEVCSDWGVHREEGATTVWAELAR